MSARVENFYVEVEDHTILVIRGTYGDKKVLIDTKYRPHVSVYTWYYDTISKRVFTVYAGTRIYLNRYIGEAIAKQPVTRVYTQEPLDCREAHMMVKTSAVAQFRPC